MGLASSGKAHVQVGPPEAAETQARALAASGERFGDAQVAHGGFRRLRIKADRDPARVRGWRLQAPQSCLSARPREGTK